MSITISHVQTQVQISRQRVHKQKCTDYKTLNAGNVKHLHHSKLPMCHSYASPKFKKKKTRTTFKISQFKLTNSDVFLTLFYIQFSNTLLYIMLLDAYTAVLIFMLTCIFLGSLLELTFSFSDSSHNYATTPLPNILMIF